MQEENGNLESKMNVADFEEEDGVIQLTKDMVQDTKNSQVQIKKMQNGL